MLNGKTPPEIPEMVIFDSYVKLPEGNLTELWVIFNTDKPDVPDVPVIGDAYMYKYIHI